MSLSTLHRDEDFDNFCVRQQLSAETDDGSRRADLRRREVRMLGDRADGCVLDLLCGVGSYVTAFAGEGRAWTSYLGIDISPRSIACARRRHGYTGAVFREGDVLAPSGPAPSWDTLLLTYEAVNNLGRRATRQALIWASAGAARHARALVDVNLAEPRMYGHPPVTLSLETQPPVPGATAVTVAATVERSTGEDTVVLREMHWSDGAHCLRHFAYRQWFPCAALAERLFAECGFLVLDRAQTHGGQACDKPSVASAWQFVIGPLRQE